MIPDTNVMVLLLGVMMALVKVIEVMVGRKGNGNGHSKPDCFRPEDREDLHNMARIVANADPKLDKIHLDNQELLREIRTLVKGMMAHFDEFQCLARKMPNKEN